LIALNCRFSAQNLRKATTKNNIFFPRKEKKEKRAKEEKKICKLNSNVAAAVKVFWKKILPEAQRRVEIFF
jgi:hypothetical protein